eukprot:2034062-Amphidinium_carterae.1
MCRASLKIVITHTRLIGCEFWAVPKDRVVLLLTLFLQQTKPIPYTLLQQLFGRALTFVGNSGVSPCGVLGKQNCQQVFPLLRQTASELVPVRNTYELSAHNHMM